MGLLDDASDETRDAVKQFKARQAEEREPEDRKTGSGEPGDSGRQGDAGPERRSDDGEGAGGEPVANLE